MDLKNETRSPSSNNGSSPTMTIPDVPDPGFQEKALEFTGPSYQSQQIRSVLLMGVPIVALVIDGQERLCLAQISNTLLQKFSYNEIHNRRVALGITCLQCTPVQLEILRRAGAMPVSSRRCGMITRREAERLCKSFLSEQPPPRLPEDFAFEVEHKCAYGCRGRFLPTRYNSSRAKCVQCIQCGLFFSPNKFIFHSHTRPDTGYIQPDAANFNAWRRHLNLADPDPSDDMLHAWEDVKAMFNGGSRKRMVSPFGDEIIIAPKIEKPAPVEKSDTVGHSSTVSKMAGNRGGIKRASILPQPAIPKAYDHGGQLRSLSAYGLTTPAPFCWPCPPMSSLLFPHPHASLLSSPPMSNLMSGALLPPTSMESRSLAVKRYLESVAPSIEALDQRSGGSSETDAHPVISAFREVGSSSKSPSPEKTEDNNVNDGSESNISLYTKLSKEKLQELLITEIQARRKLESDLQMLKDAFRTQRTEPRKMKHN